MMDSDHLAQGVHAGRADATVQVGVGWPRAQRASPTLELVSVASVACAFMIARMRVSTRLQTRC
jgi:hypothetical protein